MSWSQAVKLDPCDVLGVDRSADEQEIKAAYRRLVKSCHPDAAPGDAAAARRFQDITSAYGDLMNRQTRPQPQRTRQRQRTKTPRHGANRHMRMVLTLDDAVSGCSREVELARGVRVVARFPAGCEHGTLLRLRGWGHPGRDGGRPGDALIEVSLAPHPLFRMEGADAHLLFKAHPRQLARGLLVDAPTPIGPVRLALPAGSRPGMMLRVRGKGLPAREGRPAGDLYVTLKVGDAAAPVRPNLDSWDRQ